MTKSTLLFLFLILTTYAFNQKNSVCECLEYHKNKVNQTTPLLEFQKAYRGVELNEVSNGIFWDTLLVEHHLKQTEFLNISDFFFLNLSSDHYYQESPDIGFAKGKDTALVNSIYTQFLRENNELINNEVRLLWSLYSETIFDDGEPYHTLYIVRKAPSGDYVLTNENIESVEIESNYYNQEEYTSVRFDKLGSEAWYNFTSENLSNFISIISYNKVLSAPMINGVISGGQTIITFGKNDEENKALYNLFNCDVYLNRIGQKKFEKKLKRCK